ncbi:MAG: hypothetical protein ACT4NU_09350 [Chromatiales bacterium]
MLAILSLSVLVLAGISGCSKTSESDGDKHVPPLPTAEFALYALSRGTGVPEPTRSAFGRARQVLADARQRGEVLLLQEQRIGLEGETRLCVQARDIEVARDLLKQVRAIAEGIELFNVVEEPCAR